MNALLDIRDLRIAFADVRLQPASIVAALQTRAAAAGDPRLVVTFPVTVPKNFSEKEVLALPEPLAHKGLKVCKD